MPVGMFFCVVISLHRQNLAKVEYVNKSLMANALQNEWEEKVKSLANLLARKYVQHIHDFDIYEMKYLADLAMEGKGISYVYVQDEKGRVIVDATKGAKFLGNVLTDETTRKALTAKALIIQRQNEIVDVAAPILVGAKRYGIVRIGFSLDRIKKATDTMTRKIGDGIDNAVAGISRNMLFLLPAILIPSMLVGWFFVHKIVSPIKKLVLGTERVSKGNLTYRIDSKSKDEIGQLAISFNDMTSQLGESKRQLQDYALNLEKKVDEKTNELEKINNELRDFVYIISHDLKEPLFTIMGYTSRLSKAYEDTFDTKGMSYIDRIKANAERLNQRISEIMEVVRIGRVKHNFENIDSRVIVKDVVTTLENKIETNKINVIIQDNLPMVFCEERRMYDVFSNLVTNAIKFMGDSNQREIRIGCNKNGDYYEFVVEDTGIGIQAESHEQIFKIFRRLKDIEAEGTGVGLAIVKKIVELHKGKIWVESPVKDGRGTRFCFMIPV